MGAYSGKVPRRVFPSCDFSGIMIYQHKGVHIYKGRGPITHIAKITIV